MPENLYKVIDFSEFDFSNYYTGEKEILTPQLEALGYSQIKFSDGERDSFGPLSRQCTTVKDGATVRFWYG